MRYHSLDSRPGADPAGAETPSRAASPDALRRSALLRALLAGAIALLVLLLPGQLAASRHQVDASEAWALEAGATAGSSDESLGGRTSGIRPIDRRHGVG